MRTLIVLFVLASLHVMAAPLPMTSSSQAIAPLWGMFRSDLGFTIDGRGTGWKISEGPQENQKVLAIFSGPAEGHRSPLLTVRVDENSTQQKHKDYIKSWLTFYERLGIQVLGHQSFKNNEEQGYVLDLLNSDLNTQSRQALYFKGARVVVLTCSDEPQHFNNSLTICNKLIKSFNWGTPNPTEISIQK